MFTLLSLKPTNFPNNSAPPPLFFPQTFQRSISSTAVYFPPCLISVPCSPTPFYFVLERRLVFPSGSPYDLRFILLPAPFAASKRTLTEKLPSSVFLSAAYTRVRVRASIHLLARLRSTCSQLDTPVFNITLRARHVHPLLYPVTPSYRLTLQSSVETSG